MITLETVPSPIGPLELAAREGAVVYVSFEAGRSRTARWLARTFPGEAVGDPTEPTQPARRLATWFVDPKTPLHDLPLDLRGAEFELRVWRALMDVPLGRTTTYGALARAVGEPGAAQAVGRAMGANPIPVVVPCHRCMGGDGSMTGFGGGVERKRWLLVHEGALLL